MEQLELSRDCDAVRIPAGDSVRLPKGVEAYLTQSLGSSFTVQVPSFGGLFRIEGRDADAIGRACPAEVATDSLSEAQVDLQSGTRGSGEIESDVWGALAECYDPEIPVNIVDLGLVYDVRLAPSGGNDESWEVSVKMTLTAVGCGMGATIAKDAELRIRAIAGVCGAQVEIVWDPPWNPRMI